MIDTVYNNRDWTNVCTTYWLFARTALMLCRVPKIRRYEHVYKCMYSVTKLIRQYAWAYTFIIYTWHFKLQGDTYMYRMLDTHRRIINTSPHPTNLTSWNSVYRLQKLPVFSLSKHFPKHSFNATLKPLSNQCKSVNTVIKCGIWKIIHVYILHVLLLYMGHTTGWGTICDGVSCYIRKCTIYYPWL